MNKFYCGLTYRALVTGILYLGTQTALALEVASIHPYFEFGLEFGGEKLAEEAGGYGGTYSTNAGGGFNLGGGALFDLQGEAFNGDFIVSAGILDSNGDEADFSATRLDLVYLFDNAGSPHRFGVGAAFHFNPSLDLDPDPASGCLVFCFSSSFPVGTTDFDDAVGLTLRYEFNLFPHWHEGGGVTIGLRYTLIDYQSVVKNVDADSLGIYLTVY